MAYELSLPTHDHCSALTGLVRGSQARLASQGRLHRLGAGEPVYAMGDRTDHMYLVVDGRVRTSILSPEGRELVLGVHGPGELFGELCFCSVRQRQEQAVVLEEATVARLGVAELVTVATGAEGALALLELFCHRMAHMQEQVAELAFASVRTRLGLLLLRLAEGGTDGSAGAVFCRENLTHEEIAARISTTREQVSSLLAGFREQGLVEYRRGGPVQVFVARLRQHLERG